jgi:hypothetical protein
MTQIPSLIFVIGATAITLSSCQKNVQTVPESAPQSALQTAAPQSVQAIASAEKNGYTAHSIYQVELSANISGREGGGLWLWIGLHPDGTGDYSGADCGHGGAGTASDKGDATWHYTGLNDASIEIDGVVLVGLGGFVSTITVPSTYGHYTGTIGSFITLPDFIPPGIGFSQLQVAP